LGKARQVLEKAISSCLEAGMTIDEIFARAKKESDEIEKIEKRLIKEGYAPDIARKQAAGFYANTKF
jgi:hypothetical protein